MATVFLDLYGVLVDSDVMNRRYNERMAAILQGRFGGDLTTWLRVQAESFEWYQARGAELDRRDGAEREGDAWVRSVEDLNASQMRYVLERMGCVVPANLVSFAEDMEKETVQEIDATFSDVRPALEGLKARRHRLFLSTNANRSNAESALLGGGIREAFEGLLMLETARAKKDRPFYWRRAFEHANVEPSEAVVVDDQAHFLRPAAEMGARCLHLIRPGFRREPGPYAVIETLAAVPDLLR